MKLPLTFILLIAIFVSPSPAQNKPPHSYDLSVMSAAVPDPPLKFRLLPDVSQQTSGNAASLYLMADIMAAGRAEDFWNGVDSLNDQPPEQWDKKQVSETLGKSMLSLLDVAARRDSCDWGTAFKEQGSNTLLPHLNHARSLSNLNSLRTRLAISEGRWDDAAHSLQTQLAMANHLSGRAISQLEVLVGLGIRDNALETIRVWIATPGSPNLYWPLVDVGHVQADLRQVTQYEKQGLYYTFPELRDARAGKMSAEQYEHFAAQLALLLSQSNANAHVSARDLPGVDDLKPSALAYFKQHGVAEQQLNQMPAAAIVGWYINDDLDRRYDEIGKWLNLPYPQAYEGFKHSQQAATSPDNQNVNPLMGMLPNVSRVFTSITFLDRELIALQAIESIRADAAAHKNQPPKSLDDLTDLPVQADPMTGQPLVYQPRQDGFTLDGPAPADAAEKSFHYNVTIKQ